MKRNTLLVAALAFGLSIFAQGPNDSGTYYKNADGKKGSALKTAMYNIISDHTDIGYDGLLEAYKETDTREDGYVCDWYSKSTKFVHIEDKAGSYKKEGDVYNREHLVPQSWFGSGKPKSDLHHVVPTDGYVNNRRGNYPLGEVGSATYTSNGGYCKLGSCKTTGYNGTVFEPGDDVKGDIARIYFYMATCYENLVANWNGGTASVVFAGNKYPALNEWALDMFMRWAEDDPVDEVEKARNIAAAGIQKNRNPFVDYPGLEQYIWGTKKDQAFSYDKYEGSETPEPEPEPEPEPDGITQPTTHSPLPAIYYNLNGQRVDGSYKGIVIVNGKKVKK